MTTLGYELFTVFIRHFEPDRRSHGDNVDSVRLVVSYDGNLCSRGHNVRLILRNLNVLDPVELPCSVLEDVVSDGVKRLSVIDSGKHYSAALCSGSAFASSSVSSPTFAASSFASLLASSAFFIRCDTRPAISGGKML